MKKKTWNDYSYVNGCVGYTELREMYRDGVICDGDLLDVRCNETKTEIGTLEVNGKPDFRKNPYKRYAAGDSAGCVFFRLEIRSEKIDGVTVSGTAGELAELLS
ncbi:hypothetical protein GWN42_31455 [candidate division KSB1 bacterium]|nr:hypothetical protein [Phycisphaerae bacterium]NIQ92573.1 hypothetical protein [Deltaproteobacteria bacterium]NIV97186.1 hypothetical protein [candidate division KSB1 bacterium]